MIENFLRSHDFADTRPGNVEKYFIREHLEQASGKFFFEAGAVNGFHMSQTATLESVHGWKGILVEAHLDLFDLLAKGSRKAKPVRAFLGDPGGVTFFEQKIAGHVGHSQLRKTRINEECIVCQTQGVEEILRLHDAPPVIDFMVIDVEKGWRQAFRGIDFEARMIDFLAIEMKEKDEEIISEMIGRGYELEKILEGEDYLFKFKG